MKKLSKIFILIISVLVVSSCADAVTIDQCVVEEPSGFWSGLWHGFVAPFSFFGSLFHSSIAIYDVNNTGGWYDFGFVLGAGIIGGAGGKASS